jgi:two-component system NtrC family sensor kinase
VAKAFGLSKKMVRRIALADKEKEKMNEQMFQTGKLASVGELAAGIAHEINNPIAIMVEEAGWIDDLLEEEEFREG